MSDSAEKDTPFTPLPDHSWNGDDDGHHCASCPEDSVWRCDRPRHLPLIPCNDIETLVAAEERGETVECEHVCGDALRHAGPLDDLIASLAVDPTDEVIRQALWEDAVERGETWATPDLGDDPDGDLDEIEAIAEARAAGYGYQPIPPGRSDSGHQD